MSMAIFFIVLIFVYLCWAYVKPAIQNLGLAAEHATEALAKGAVALNAKAGEDLDEALLQKIEEQRKLLKK